ncbi:uncharacterized protein LOC122500747 [Leptopilina heterotoma]|uniref:uncharacterized protein LOC122500747 n=1 Tax=Leptopilina heterotoma TaxID=63436 RepID=UPI001CA94513|nr:uncharacterized protein LOC122500747 [Leptopilina heterotoma]
MRDNPVGLWDIERNLADAENYECDNAQWVQEYLWSWDERRYKFRCYWCPEDFLMPSLCDKPENELVEGIIGLLGVNLSSRPFTTLPAFPPNRGFRPKNSIFELVFIQRYRKDWEDLVLSFSGWELRWKLDASSVWVSQ